MRNRSNSGLSSGNVIGSRRSATTMRLACLCCWLSVGLSSACGCQLLTPKPSPPQFISGGHQVTGLKKGDPAPEDGFFVPPPLMAELGPYLAEPYRKPK